MKQNESYKQTVEKVCAMCDAAGAFIMSMEIEKTNTVTVKMYLKSDSQPPVESSPSETSEQS